MATAQLICVFVFVYVKNRFSHDAAQMYMVLVWVEALRPSQQFFSMSRRSHRFLGFTSTFWEVNVSCSRIQHGEPSEDRTPDLSLRSPTLYH